MRRVTKLPITQVTSFLLLAAAYACSGSDPSPTDLRPEFAGGCSNTPIITPNPASVSIPAGGSGTSSFSVKNGCASISGPWDITASRTGSVSTAGPPSKTSITFAVGQTVTVTVPFTTGAAGSGTVVLKALMDHDPPPPLTSSGTQNVTVTGGPLGIPFGPFEFFTSASQTETIGTQWFNLSTDGITAPNIIARINAAKGKGIRLLTNMTGGPHDQYMSIINDTLRFDMSKWMAKMDTYRNQTIQTAVANAVRDGIIIGNSVMDEPNVFGNAEGGGNTWGPEFTMNKARVDTMCAYAKGIFPTLPMGVALRHDRLDSTKKFATCEFIIDQYVTNAGDVSAFGAAALAFAKGHSGAFKIAFSMNIVNGGTQDTDGTWDCTGTGGLGDRKPNCRMTASQIRTVGQTLGVEGCAMTMWKYDNTASYMSNTANQQAFQDVRTLLNSKPAKSCKRQ